MAVLIICSGPDRDNRFTLHPTGNQIGRSGGSEASIVLNDATVSGDHAIIRQEASSGDWLLEDLGSTNGTFINNEQVHQARLAHGAVIWFGDVEARFETGRPNFSTGKTPSPRPEPQEDLSTRLLEILRNKQATPTPTPEPEGEPTPKPAREPAPLASPTPAPARVPAEVLERLRKGSALLRMGSASGESVLHQLEDVVSRLDAATSEPDPEVSREVVADVVDSGGSLREATIDLSSMLETLTGTLDYFDRLLNELEQS